MTQVQLGLGAWDRSYANEPIIKLENRFLETDPTNLQTGAALLSRPGNDILAFVGAGPIRATYTHRGTFNNDLFIVSGEKLWRLSEDGTKTPITGAIAAEGSPQMVTVAGTGFEHLWLSDGTNLFVYQGSTPAVGTLTHTPGTIADDIVIIAATHYQFAADPTTDAGANGTVANPWQVDVGASDADSLENLFNAINATGTAGVTYSTNLLKHVTVEATAFDTTTVDVKARVRGSAGDLIPTTVTLTGGDDGLAWGGATLSGGGLEALLGIAIPNDSGAVALDALVGYVLVSTASDDRFYYIAPGALTVEALDFATAERQADKILDIVTVGAQVWMLGETTAEPWYPTGDSTNPFAPIQGRTLSIGILSGTAVRVNERVVVVGDDDRVYALAGGATPISTHAIEEKIRLSRELIKENT